MKNNNYIIDELERVCSRRLYPIVLLILPLFSIIFLSTIFGRGIIEELPVGAVDYTGSRLSGEILQKIDASDKLRIIKGYANEDEAIRAMQGMEIYGFAVIPPNFDKELYGGNKPEVVYYYHKSVLAAGEQVNGAFLKVLADVAASLLQTSGSMGGLDKESIKAVAMPVNINGIPEYNSNLNFRVYITYPFIFIFLQIIFIVFTVYLIGDGKMIERNIREIPGRVAPYLMLFALYAILSTFICFTLLDIPSDGGFLPLMVSGILLFCATVGVGVVIATIIPNISIAVSVASMYGALGATMCGVTFPIDQMAGWAEAVAELFPVRHFTRIYHNLIYHNLSIIHSLKEVAALALFTSLIWVVPYLASHIKRDGKLYRRFRSLPVIYGVALIAAGGTMGYALLYNVLYLPNKVKEMPIAVTDASGTPLSREFISYLDATEGVKVAYSEPDYINSVNMMQQHKVRGIIYIPADFAQRIATAREAIFIMDGTTTSFLYYLTLQESCVGALQKINEKYRGDVVKSLPLEGKLMLAKAPQMQIAGISLTNQNGGYATFLIPVVFIVALFQTMIMAMGVWQGSLAGKANRELLRHKSSPVKIILFATGFYLLVSIFVIGLAPLLFNLPYSGDIAGTMIFIALFLLATATAGYLLSTFFTDSESVNLVVPFFSIGLIFLSGMSFPRECMPWIWQMCYYIFPCTPAITGYIKLNSLGAEFGAVGREILILAIQTIAYLLIGLFITYKKRRACYKAALP